MKKIREEGRRKMDLKFDTRLVVVLSSQTMRVEEVLKAAKRRCHH